METVSIDRELWMWIGGEEGEVARLRQKNLKLFCTLWRKNC